jgi:hypothetical protein
VVAPFYAVWGLQLVVFLPETQKPVMRPEPGPERELV